MVIFNKYIFLTRKKYLADIKVNSISFKMWEQSLAKRGYPKNGNGTMMSIWELYEYWDNWVSKSGYLIHANDLKLLNGITKN